MQDVSSVLTALARLEQDVKHMSKQLEAISKLTESTVRHNESIKSAHKRIDEVEKAIEEMRADSKWTWRAFAGGIIAYVIDKFFI